MSIDRLQELSRQGFQLVAVGRHVIMKRGVNQNTEAMNVCSFSDSEFPGSAWTHENQARELAEKFVDTLGRELV